MKWKILTILSIILGSYLGVITYDQKTKKLEDEINSKDCEIHDKKLLFEDEIKKRCITRFQNRGDQFDLSQESISQKVYNLFKRDLQYFDKDPNSFNVYKANPSGKVFKYDPRLAHFLRIPVSSFVMNNELISNYSIINKDVVDVRKALHDLTCVKPIFKKIKSTDGLKVFNEYLSKNYTDKKKRLRHKLTREDFSAFQELEQKVGWFMYFVYNRNTIENFLLANECNKSLALVLNHCVIDPGMDIQMEEIFWFSQNEKIGINIYCRNSNQKEWTLKKSKILTTN